MHRSYQEWRFGNAYTIKWGKNNKRHTLTAKNPAEYLMKMKNMDAQYIDALWEGC